MKRIIKTWTLGMFLTALVVMLGTACNTSKGIGEDIEDAGDEIEDALD